MNINKEVNPRFKVYKHVCPTGKKASKETREKLSKAHSNISDETRRKISEACKGEKNGFYGKHHSEEAKLKMRLAWERRRCQ